MPYKIDIECPVEGCSKIVKNTGALGNHLKGHGIEDNETRANIVSKAKEMALKGEKLKAPLDRLLEEFKHVDTHELNGDMRDTQETHSSEYNGDTFKEEVAKPIAPSPRVLAMVDNMDTAEYLEDSFNEGEIAIYKKRIPITVRSQPITLSPEVYIYYDFVRQHGYTKSLSEFINEVVRSFFLERGIGIGVVILDNE